MPMNKNNLLIWIDLEMTGLDTTKDTIIEVATLLTDNQLNEVATGPVLAVSQPPELFEQMDEWNRKHHYGSGLVQRCLESNIDMAEAEAQTIDFLAEHLAAETSPMCGNSICQDRRFLARLMPDLERFFHYRNLDVSTVSELARRWYGETLAPFKKTRKHLALEDIRESVEELKHFRTQVFIPSSD